MLEKDSVVEIYKPNFIVRLYEKALLIDLKGNVKNEVEEALENRPVLRETLGHVLSIFVPLHIRLSDIDSVHMDKMGNVKIHLPYHRDIVFPLEAKEGKKLVNKLNELIPKAKEEELDRIIKEHKLQKTVKEERMMEKEEEEIMPVGGAQFPIPEPTGMREKIKEAEEKIIEEEQKK